MGCLLSKRLGGSRSNNIPVSTLTSIKPLKRETNGVNKNLKPNNIIQVAQKEETGLRMRKPPPAPSCSPVLNKRRKDWESNLNKTHNVHLVEDLEYANKPTQANDSDPTGSSKDQLTSTSGVGQSSDSLEESASNMGSRFLSIEELDTEIASYTHYSAERFPLRAGDRINPATTDILLPRRKLKPDDLKTAAPKSGGKIIIENAHFTDLIATDVVPTVANDPEAASSNGKTEMLKKETSNTEPPSYATPEHDANKFIKSNPNKSETNVALQPRTHNLRKTKHLHDIFDGLDEGKNGTIDKLGSESIGQMDEIHVGIRQSPVALHGNKPDTPAKSPPLKGTSVFLSGQIKMADHEVDRLKRKRKRARKPRSNSQFGSMNSLDRLSDTGTRDTEVPLLNKTTLRSRPTSGASTITIDSFNTLGSSLPTSRNNTFIDNYDSADKIVLQSHDKVNEVDLDNTELFDIENDHNEGNEITTYVAASKDNEWKDLNKKFGIRPADDHNNIHNGVFDNANLADLDKKIVPVSGSSSSAVFTKQKLMYSRFARRRPNSDTRFSIAGKPPIPPARGRRPMSETILNPTHVPRYYTEDMDLHDV